MFKCLSWPCPATFILLLFETPILAVYCSSSYIFWLIGSLVDPTLAAFIVWGPLQFLVAKKEFVYLSRISHFSTWRYSSMSHTLSLKITTKEISKHLQRRFWKKEITLSLHLPRIGKKRSSFYDFYYQYITALYTGEKRGKNWKMESAGNMKRVTRSRETCTGGF